MAESKSPSTLQINRDTMSCLHRRNFGWSCRGPLRILDVFHRTDSWNRDAYVSHRLCRWTEQDTCISNQLMEIVAVAQADVIHNTMSSSSSYHHYFSTTTQVCIVRGASGMSHHVHVTNVLVFINAEVCLPSSVIRFNLLTPKNRRSSDVTFNHFLPWECDQKCIWIPLLSFNFCLLRLSWCNAASRSNKAK